MKQVFKYLLVCFFILSAAPGSTGTVEVKVSVEGFNSNAGLCRLLVYGTEKGFPEDPDLAVLIMSGDIKDKKTEFTFMIPSGTYAISILHDSNSNEKLDKTWYGKPKEGFGISNNPKIRFGPPKFEESSVKFEAGKAELKIKITYL
jgi:uncharacterized protein (DUF2141 family)